MNILEFQDLTTLFEVVTAVQRTEMVMRIVEEINMYILELGNEGRLISMQLNELVKHVERDGILLIKDYCKDGLKYTEVYEVIQKLNATELLDLDSISRALGYSGTSLMDTLISPKGYRILSKVPRIPASVIDNLIKEFKELSNVIDAEIIDLDNVEGIGDARATAIKDGLKRIKEHVLLKKEI